MGKMGKIPLLAGPTPLMHAPAVSRLLGIDLYIKRDDLTPLGAGGNKLRKLEYLVFDAMKKGATTLLTFGGVQTNHGRLTAAAAAACGLKCVILCIDEYPGEVSANLLLDTLMGAHVVIKQSDGTPENLQNAALAKEITAKLEADGEVVYEIPVGGSNTTGLLGYYDCAVELNAQSVQMGIDGCRLVSPVGSIGTYLGLFCGLKNIGSNINLTGIAISPFKEAKEERIVQLFKAAKAEYGFDFDAEPHDFYIEKGYDGGGYNLESKEVREAIALLARTEAVLLDPCYTGKAFWGLLQMVKEGKIKKGEQVIFLHTGGFPALYTPHHRREFEKELMSNITIIK